MPEKKGFPLRLDPEIYDALQRWAASEFRSVNGQIEYLLRTALRDTGRLMRRVTLRNEKGQSEAALPAALLRSTPRHVRLSAGGATVVLVAVLLLAGGVWAEIYLYRQARISEAHVVGFDLERIVTGAQVTAVERRGGEDGRRSTITYQYTVNGREHTGSSTVRTSDRNAYRVGSPVAVWYLPSEPDASWMDGDAPHVISTWPALIAFAVCGLTSLCLILLVRRQSNLLAYGRPAMAVIRKVDKKKSDKGTYWRVQYEWTLLSGATRHGHYSTHGKHPPAVGASIPIVYDRDRPSRNSRYPLSLVTIA
jgi:hypothetical protein